jgi:YHS domain-containing protein
MDFFNSLFVTDAPDAVRIVENIVVGPLVAVLSFVCSVGNVPLAAVLWAGGISFPGVIAFIYADLIVIPIILIYRKYYGLRLTVRMVAIMFVTMAVAALAISAIFDAADLIPSDRPDIESITQRGVGWNYTTFLNIVFLAIAAALVGLTLRRGARDPVCGMTVDRSQTPHRATYAGETYYFCSAGCKGRFEADPDRYLRQAAGPAHEHAHAGHDA